jgi:phage terminase Nu1 subunit (DNA packaging protein)
MALSAFEPVTRQDMAGLLGVSLRTFSELEAKGAVTPTHRGKGGQPSAYDVRVTIRAYLAWKAKEAPRDRLFRLQADKVEIENKVRKGELLEAGAVAAEWSQLATGVRRAVTALPGLLVQAGAVSLDKVAAATEICHGVFRHLENGRR